MKMTRSHFGANKMIARGFGLVSAIFLLVVLAGLGVAMLAVSTMEHHETALDVQGVRAYQAAKAGIEWGVYRYVNDTTTCTGGTSSFTPPGGSFVGFVVSVTCTPDTSLKPTAVIRSVACNRPSGGQCPPVPLPTNADYVERVVEVRL
jgi:MSHA biogenesis protein MshP